MTFFISYAQNFEDVMLWRALKNISKGFYIDIGAAWPDKGSVTKAFYDRGWSGINVEPNVDLYPLLIEQRQRDINLQQAVGHTAGLLAMTFLDNPGLSTAIEAIADNHKQAGWVGQSQEVETTTLANIFQQHVSPGTDVHFLKIDVEGMEKSVLEGNDWTQCRPWIVIIEATLPMTQIECHEEWEPILLDAHYSFAYADGLNRFYVAHEHAELLPAFKYPPNVWDAYIVNEYLQQHAEALQKVEIRQQETNLKLHQAEALAKLNEEKARQFESLAHQANLRIDELLAQIHGFCTSRSWRITTPLRWMGRHLPRLALKRRIVG